jgi:hypothetical protein
MLHGDSLRMDREGTSNQFFVRKAQPSGRDSSQSYPKKKLRSRGAGSTNVAARREQTQFRLSLSLVVDYLSLFFTSCKANVLIS